MSEAIAAAVFDLDGVLVDSEAFLDTAGREIVVWNGGHWQADATRAMMGMSSPDWSRYLHDQLGVPLEPKQINELVVAALARSIRPPAAVARSGRGGQTARGPLVAWARIVGEPLCDRCHARACGNHRLLRNHRLG
jgi:hypothetical protein